MVTAFLVMGGLGLLASVGLGIAAKVFFVKEDPRLVELEGAMPGANCGGCGYAGCAGAAEAVLKGEAEANVCVAGGEDAAIGVAGIMGLEIALGEKQVAELICQGGIRAEEKYRYKGVTDCRAAMMLYGGEKTCSLGCLGFGTCVKSCLFGAIHMGKDGIPVFNPNKCTGCGACVKNCPKGIIRLRTPSDRILSFNTLNDCLAPCQQTCPAQIDIPTYIEHINEGRYEEALLTIKERNPLPLTCGRVCPHPCEAECRRGEIEGEEPVNINHLKRFVADMEMNSGRRYKVYVAPDTGHRVALIGGGPASLTCAYYLRRLGHSPVIFEAMPKLGGMLRYGIPEYRLPKKVLDWEIQGILDLGVEARTNVRFGRDFDLEYLLVEGYKAVFIAAGAWNCSKMRVEGEDDIEGVLPGTEFLMQQAMGQPMEIGKKVAIIGGGNTAIDASRSALRMGAEEVTIVYRRSRKEMPAAAYEVDAAEEEGVKFHFLAAPARFIGDEKGRLKQMEFIRMELGEPDSSGRRRPVPIEGSETLLDIDNVIAAIGQRPDVSFVQQEKRTGELKLTRWDTIEADESTLVTDLPYVLTGGDLFTGAATVVEAIGAGRLAARSIHLHLKDEEVAGVPDAQRKRLPESVLPSIEGVGHSERAEMPEIPVAEREHNEIEVELGLSEEQTRTEAARCLRCGITCYNREVAGREAA